MPPVPSVPGSRVVAVLERHGFKLVRVRGSHHIMHHPPVVGPRRTAGAGAALFRVPCSWFTSART